MKDNIIGASNITTKQVNDLMRLRKIEELRLLRKLKIMKISQQTENSKKLN